MNKVHNNINWENYPSGNTPINDKNLNKMDMSIDIIDDRVIALDTTKATKEEVAPLISDVQFNEHTGTFTITRKNGSLFVIDTKLEKIAINWTYDVTTQQIILTLDDGTKQYIDLSALITQYEFLDTDTINFQVQTDGTVKAIVKNGSITEDKLQPNYLAQIKVESAKAQASETNAASSAKKAESWAHGNTGIRAEESTNNSKYWSEQSKEYADSWKGSLLPQGTIAFSQIPINANIAGHMYNINEAFVTDSRFKDGAGYSYPAGTNIYWTQDGKWDCLSGTLTRTLTQEEYNNLTNAQKMNGTIYYIYDADNSIGNANENTAGLMSPEDKEKLDNIETGAQVNVQGDWNITDNNSASYIKNKPQTMKNPFALTISLNSVSQGVYDGSSQKNVNITAENIGADLSGTAQTKVFEHNSSKESHADIRNLITTLTSTVAEKANKAGDEFTGDVTFDNYIKIKAWPGYGTGSANMWFNANTKTIDFNGDVLNIDLNATSSNNADTVDGKHATDFVSKSGDEMTGDLRVPAGRSSRNMSVPCCGRIDGQDAINNITDFSKYKTFLGSYYDKNNVWHNIISIRHGNGSSDGQSYGMYLKSYLTAKGDLSWGKQIGPTGGWQEERTLLDSSNYKNYCTPANIGTLPFRELTQVQYNSLSNTEKMNGTLYFITDAN